MSLFKYFLFLAALLNFSGFYAQHTLKGKITSDSLGTALPNVEVVIHDLRISAQSDADGKFTINGLPTTKAIIQFRRIGFKTLLLNLSFSADTSINVVMEESAIEGHEVVITGNASTSDHEESSSPVYFIHKDQLRESAPNNVIDGLSKTPGFSQVSTGPFVSKPVIRGLSYNRVLLLHDGIRQEGQQWGDEHGVEIDANSPGRIEILRGPASLLYGSDAMGGVINIMDPFPAPWNTGEGEFSMDVHSNNQMGSTSLMLQGNKEGWVWRVVG